MIDFSLYTTSEKRELLVQIQQASLRLALGASETLINNRQSGEVRFAQGNRADLRRMELTLLHDLGIRSFGAVGISYGD